jgi:hypothetical protein
MNCQVFLVIVLFTNNHYGDKRIIMKLHLFFISLLSISFVTMPIHSMQSRWVSELDILAARAIAFSVSAATAGVSLGAGVFGTYVVLKAAMRKLYSKNDELAHALCSLINVPALFVGSCATYTMLLSVGVKDRYASKTAGTLFGSSMLLNSLSHWINVKQEYVIDKKLCIGMGAFTGLSGLAALGLCLRKYN